MADEPDELDDELELTPDMQTENEPEAEPDEDEDDGDEDDDGEQTVIGFDDDAGEEAKPDNATIRKMRQELRERDKRIAELSRAREEPEIVVGPEPDWDEDAEKYDWDQSKWKSAWLEWNDKKAQAETVKVKREEGDREVQQAWQSDMTRYQGEKASLGVSDFEDAETAVTNALDLSQQAVIVKAAEKPARFLYALSKSDARLAELAKIKDPIKMAAAVARMEGAVKDMKRKTPEPDRPQRGTASMPGSAAKTLEKLEKDAQRTGDRTAVIAYNLAQQEKANK